MSDLLADLEKARFLERLQAKDPSLWTQDKAQQRFVRNSLGWLDLPRTMAVCLGGIRSLAAELKAEGFKTTVVLGMGGASLACEVFRALKPGLEVLDTTNPADILALQARLDLRRAFFIAASKSGSTVETNCLLSHFHGLLLKEGLKPEKHFAAITDPGTSLEKKARRMGFRKVFLNPTDVGGRYSALSYFGLVPAALAGLDAEAMLSGARRLGEDLAPALELGAELAGRDTLCLKLPAGFSALRLWIEQLVAESTGKQGKGILLVEEAGKRPIPIDIRDESGLGRQFLLWETAVAAAGFLLGVNPFDQPDVEGAKERTGEILEHLLKGRLAPETPSLRAGGLAAFCDAELAGILGAQPGIDLPLRDVLAAHLGRLKKGDFCGLLAFTADQEPDSSLLGLLKERLRAATGVPITLGMGPRYLHSTGQFHKGGPPRGLYLMIVAQDAKDLAIPARGFTFGTLHKAQARGDFQAMLTARRRILRLDLGPAGANSLRACLNSLGGSSPCQN